MGKAWQRCGTCQGTGYVTHRTRKGQHNQVCRTCSGKGGWWYLF